jgi:DNA-binding LytR/AlgR family response regulator
MNATVYFIDDDEIERRSCLDVLKEIFADTPLSIEALAPLPALADYTELVNRGPAGLILDHRLNTSGRVLYSGAELAAHLRAIGSRVPIVILTNYPDDDFSAQGWAVERIVQKKNTLRDPTGVAAQEFKLRLLRQIETCGNILAARERRFNELLIKSSRERLTTDEEKELRQLEGERISSVAAAEREKQIRLDAEIESLKKLLGHEHLL